MTFQDSLHFHVISSLYEPWSKSIFKHAVTQIDNKSWPWGYKTFFMLNSTEHEISKAHKN